MAKGLLKSGNFRDNESGNILELNKCNGDKGEVPEVSLLFPLELLDIRRKVGCYIVSSVKIIKEAEISGRRIGQKKIYVETLLIMAFTSFNANLDLEAVLKIG